MKNKKMSKEFIKNLENIGIEYISEFVNDASIPLKTFDKTPCDVCKRTKEELIEACDKEMNKQGWT